MAIFAPGFIMISAFQVHLHPTEVRIFKLDLQMLLRVLFAVPKPKKKPTYPPLGSTFFKDFQFEASPNYAEEFSQKICRSIFSEKNEKGSQTTHKKKRVTREECAKSFNGFSATKPRPKKKQRFDAKSTQEI